MNRILVIEGNPYLENNILKTLTDEGFEVTTTPDYFEALKILEECKFSLIVIDEEMLAANVFEACTQLFQSHNTPIILIGRDSGIGGLFRAVEAGADSYIKKPISYVELAARAKAILRRYTKNNVFSQE